MLKIFKSSYFKSIAVLASGSIIAQLITIIFTPIISRIYSPEILGVYTYTISVASIFMCVINGRYDISIVTEKDENNVLPLVKLSLIIGFCITILGTIGILIYFIISDIEAYIVIYIFLMLLSFAIINVLTAYNNRRKEYKTISSVYIVRTAAQNLGGALLGLVTTASHCLLIPYVIGQALGIRRQGRPLKGKWNSILNVDDSKIKLVAKSHKNQPLFSVPALLINSLSYSLITIFVEDLYGMYYVGQYSVSVRLLGLPLALIGGNVSKVFTERAAKEYNQYGCYTRALTSTAIFLICIAVPMVAILIMYSQPLCTLFLGDQWSIAGNYIAILAPMFGVRLITSALSPALIIAEKQKNELLLQSIFIISCIVSFWITKTEALVITDFLRLISVTYTISYVIYLLYIYKFRIK